MTKPAFRVETSIDEATGRVVAAYLRVREGEVARRLGDAALLAHGHVLRVPAELAAAEGEHPVAGLELGDL